MMTSPQRFARVIKSLGASAFFDAYAHHPYTPGATRDKWPEAPPRDPSTIVTLQNLGTLLKLFPSKPFYLTEYGYQTAACSSWSGQFISLAQHAEYLRRAYAYAGRYSQVKMLMWFLLDDWSPSGEPDDYHGVYSGLRDVYSTEKPSWYAFAGGNHLTLSAPSLAAAGAAVTLSGTLSSWTDEPIGAKSLVLQRRTAGSSWTKLTTAKTDAQGFYAVTIKPARSASYRIVWTGVVTSPVRSIKL